MDMWILPWAAATSGFALAAGAALELRRRREMVARACHELRGPLTAVRLSLATMERRGEAPPERLAVLDHELRRACLALDDFAAARSGRRTLDREEPVEIAELVEEQFHSWEPVAGAFDSVLSLGTLVPARGRRRRSPAARAGDLEPDRERARARTGTHRAHDPGGRWSSRQHRGGRRRTWPAMLA